jgi:HPt (histidine-containing phosphotransfer) domain-containing protein
MNSKTLWSDPDFMEMVIDYVEAHSSRCEEWSFELAMSNLSGFCDEAHKIAGSAGMYGFDALGNSARLLEEAIRSGSPDYVIYRHFQNLKNQMLKAHEEALAYGP